MEKYLFKDWESLLHIGLCALISYVVLFTFIRITGKRTLTKLNAFDFVVTVSLGSTLSSMILGKSPIAEAMLALAVIIGLQFLLAYSAKKSQTIEKIINNSPTLLYYNGVFIESAMEKEIITEDEIHAEIRKYRIEHLEHVRAVVMELNGEITVIKKSTGRGPTSLQEFEVDNGIPTNL